MLIQGSNDSMGIDMTCFIQISAGSIETTMWAPQL